MSNHQPAEDYLSQQKALVGDLEQSFLNGQLRSTVVDMQNNYANDGQICLTSVTFVPDNVAQRIIEQVVKPLSSIDAAHYFYTPDSLHLTIKNVRTVHKPPLFSHADVEKVDRLFRQRVPLFYEFEFSVEDVLLFPTSISVMAYSSNELQNLVISLHEGLQDIGVPDNKKYLSDTVFWGNITLCRFTHEPSGELIKAIKKMRKLKLGKFKLHDISLITCNSVCHPHSRKVIGTYQLRKAGIEQFAL